MAHDAMKPRLVGGPGYAPLSEGTIRPFLLELPHLAARLGGPADAWSIREVGDGNLNLVFIVKGPDDGLVIKQALPYLRLIGEGWPLPLERAFFEHEALLIQANLAPRSVPTVYHFDRELAAVVMELLEPHIILRKGLIQGIVYPKLALHMARFAASTLFGTSDLACPAAVKRERQALFSRNLELCKITEDLVFTDPYRIAPMNRCTSPQLDGIAARFRSDGALKVAVQELKWIFLSRGEALIHGDLHTGSVMVTGQDTRIIDPEFACIGPIGFDLGAFMANLLLAYFSQPGHASPADDRRAYGEWILQELEAFWNGFEANFLALWRQGGAGDAFAGGLFDDPAARGELEGFRKLFLARVFNDSLGFAGAKMARRILGLAHVEDLESITDLELRAQCEIKALQLARVLMVERAGVSSVAELSTLARQICSSSRS